MSRAHKCGARVGTDAPQRQRNWDSKISLKEEQKPRRESAILNLATRAREALKRPASSGKFPKCWDVVLSSPGCTQRTLALFVGTSSGTREHWEAVEPLLGFTGLYFTKGFLPVHHAQRYHLV